ncbi:MAG TPA: hypothetical protein VIG51_04260 [Candidatus Baltobacteraceae bacterium]|jgi:hypothetical protein
MNPRLPALAVIAAFAAGCSATQVAGDSGRMAVAIAQCTRGPSDSAVSLKDPRWRAKVQAYDGRIVSCLRAHGVSGEIRSSYEVRGGKAHPRITWTEKR